MIRESDEHIMVEAAPIKSLLQHHGGRGNTFEMLVRDLALRHHMPRRIREEALAAGRVHDRLVAGMSPVPLERDFWRAGTSSLADWLDREFSGANDPSSLSSQQATQSAGRHRGRRLQPWLVLAVLVTLVALAAAIFHEVQLRAGQPAVDSPGADRPAIEAMKPAQAPAHHERWRRSRAVRDSDERG